jgi:hypothetical protein
VLVQLIRNAPNDFNPKVIEAHATKTRCWPPAGRHRASALPWGRVRPILNTLGELYFSDKIKHAVRMSTLDAARLDELARGLEMQWTGGEQLREMGAR